ncbi:MAG: PIG-L family deacetylase, partial [Clostridia bacterium]|nr:PIG-L family deacetylase [Clostridia bacterium]
MAYLLAVVMVILSFAPAALAADGINAAYYKLVEVQMGTVAGETKVNVRERPDAESDRMGRLDPGESCVVTGEDGDWWQIEFENETGYVLKELLTVTTTTEEIPVIVEDPLEASITGLTPPTLLQYRNEYEVNGVISSNIPMTKVTVEIYNRRTFTVDRSASAEFERDQNIREFDLEDIAGRISFRKVEPGEKTLIITVESANDSQIVSETPFYVYTDGDMYADPASMTGECEIEVPGGRKANLTDYNYNTTLELDDADDCITIRLPQSRTAGSITVHWNTAPSAFSIAQLDASGAPLETILEDNKDGRIHFFVELDAKARTLQIATPDEGKSICELRVYELNKEPDMIEQWQAMPEKLDLLVVSTHQDDEMLFFGGTIPYYAMQDKRVGVVYMANCSRLRYAEALDGLWSCGLKYHPIFVGFRDKLADDYEEAVDLWGWETTENALVDIIRKYQPDVIVTHDVNGEYGHNQHKVN